MCQRIKFTKLTHYEFSTAVSVEDTITDSRQMYSLIIVVC